MISISFLAWTAMLPSRLTSASHQEVERDVEVGSGQVELVLAGRQQQVREDRDGGLALDDALHRGQLAQELATGDADFHSLFSV